MASLEELLQAVAQDAEARLRAQLTGFFGGMVRQYLPQAWVFRTEQGATSLLVSAEGKFSVEAGEAPRPDVVVELPLAELTALLERRQRPATPPKVTTPTAKGRAAFGQLRGRLGL